VKTIADNAKNSFPIGVTLDGEGNIYVTDYWKPTIRKVNLSGDVITIVGSGELGVSDGIKYPMGMALDYEGNLYVCEKYQIRKIT